jgi:hypothetical protein
MQKMAVNRDNTGRFVKGNKSGGRPAQPEEFKRVVRENALPALLTLIEIMRDADAKQADRIKAAEIVIERAYGKAPQAVDMNVKSVSEDTQKLLDKMLGENREEV